MTGLAILFGALLAVFTIALIYIDRLYKRREKELREKLRRWQEEQAEQIRTRIERAEQTARRHQPTDVEEFVDYLNRVWKERNRDD